MRAATSGHDSVSIKLDRILAYPWLPERAGEKLGLLVAVLVESLLARTGPVTAGAVRGAEITIGSRRVGRRDTTLRATLP